MKTRKLKFVTAALLILFVSCQEDPPQTVEGIILDSTKDSITIRSTDGDTLLFNTTTINRTEEDIISPEDTVTIDYTGKIKGTNTRKAVVIRMFLKRANFVPIYGTWIESDPATNRKNASGLKLGEDGDAFAINTDTLAYQKWASSGNKLMIIGETLGNEKDSTFIKIFRIENLTLDSLVLRTEENRVINYFRQEEAEEADSEAM